MKLPPLIKLLSTPLNLAAAAAFICFIVFAGILAMGIWICVLMLV